MNREVQLRIFFLLYWTVAPVLTLFIFIVVPVGSELRQPVAVRAPFFLTRDFL
jgi:hypothetical protein